jgi:hypothetical protein
MAMSDTIRYVLIAIAAFIFITALPMLILRVRSGKITKKASIIAGSIILVVIIIILIVALVVPKSKDDEESTFCKYQLSSSKVLDDMSTVSIDKSTVSFDGNVIALINSKTPNTINVYARNADNGQFDVNPVVFSVTNVERIAINEKSIFSISKDGFNIYRQDYEYVLPGRIGFIGNPVQIPMNIASKPIEFLVDAFNGNLLIAENTENNGCVINVYDDKSETIIQTLNFTQPSYGDNLLICGITQNIMLTQTTNTAAEQLGTKFIFFNRTENNSKWAQKQESIISGNGKNPLKNVLIGNDILLTGTIAENGELKNLNTYLRNNFDEDFDFSQDDIPFINPDPFLDPVFNWAACIQPLNKNSVIFQAFDSGNSKILTYTSIFEDEKWSPAIQLFSQDTDVGLDEPFKYNIYGDFGSISNNIANEDQAVTYIPQNISKVSGITASKVTVLTIKCV